MQNVILDEIVSARRADIASLGCSFGLSVPVRRERGAAAPFLAQKGVVLEVKRASPSKGDIAPGLDAGETSARYVEAGAAAISVLTEGNFFKGSLRDLLDVAAAVDAGAGRGRVAVLRKDFLLFPEEVDVSYRCGADAVLLIARILDDDTLVAMASRCAELGLTALLELRLADDVRKLRLVAGRVDARYIVCGVNSRDLADFSIDLLAPAGMLDEIREVLGADARVVFESGIRTPQAAAFVGGMGFAGLLLGEAAARSPADAGALVEGFVRGAPTPHAAAWRAYASLLRERRRAGGRPFLKVCGLTSVHDALYAALGGADFLGFILSARSPRAAAVPVVRRVRAVLDEQFRREGQLCTSGPDDHAPLLVGVITECDSAEGQAALALAREGVLDFLQLHGTVAVEQFLANPDVCQLPHYAVVNVTNEEDASRVAELCLRGEPRVLIDSGAGGRLGGTGIRIADDAVRAAARTVRLWLAGGLAPDTVGAVIRAFHPELIDVNSGVEEAPGTKDVSALLRLDEAVASACGNGGGHGGC